MTSPIAIVGMSCRLSGDVSTLEDFWTFVSRSRDGWCPVPEGRFSKDAFYHPNPQKKGCFNQKGGYFMNDDLAKFDAPFFHITKEEAMAIDPQQRLLLECTYEALENAGIPMESIAGRSMGVFVGGKSSDYRLCTLRDLQQSPLFDATGNHQSIQAGRISYNFDLRGPCLAVDTACSSSLYALHSAIHSIRSGESDSAIVAGCSLHLHPDDVVSMSMLGIFNDAGRTFAFDHRADSGFARGEGVGCLVLKPLEQALRDNDRIRSVIVNSGTNQDGKTMGLTTPSGESQERLMRDVYARANISPQDTGFVEAHGTGTRVGDPVEAGAIYRVFGPGRTKRSPLYVGSVKTNFGHLENASGIISVIKATLMLEKGFILPNANFEKANDAIPLQQWNMKVPVSIRPWPKGKRYISVNSFGFGGSNAHVVLEHPPSTPAEIQKPVKKEAQKLFVLSGSDEGAAKRVASLMGVYIEEHPEVFQIRQIHDLAYSLGERRTHLPWRIAIAASSCNEFAASLNTAAAIPKRVGKSPKLAFVYTGQGAQWPRMGHELTESHPIFADTVIAAAVCLERLGANFSLLDELSKGREESILGKAHISQPVCTAIQLGLTALLSSWGVHPSVVLGHSSGEIGAAYAAGAISIDDAMAVAYYRGLVASKLKEKKPGLRGAMAAVGAGPLEVKALIKLHGLENVGVACENSPNSVTVSGDEDSVDMLVAELERGSTFTRKLHVDVAYHSYHMKLAADDYFATIGAISPKVLGQENVAFYSSLLGNRVTTAALGPSYWVDNLTKPVLFSTALRQVYQEVKPDAIVEIGPHSVLEGPIKEVLKSIGAQAASEVRYMPSLIRDQHATAMMHELAGALFTHGQPLDFSAVNHIDPNFRRPLPSSGLPTYPWSGHRYWFESRSSRQHRLKPFARHDLLGRLDDTYSDVEPIWRNALCSDDVPWLKHHRMQSLPTFPMAGYLCMAVEAAAQKARLRDHLQNQIYAFRLREIQISKALILEDGVQYETALSIRPYEEGTRSYSSDWDEFRISSWASARGWVEHCRGLVSVKKRDLANPINDSRFGAARARRQSAMYPGGHGVCLEKFYDELQKCGASYGSIFKLQKDSCLKFQDAYATASVTVPDSPSAMPLGHETPSILPVAFTDLFFQLTFSVLGAGQGTMPSLFMPSAIRAVDISSKLPHLPGDKLQVVAHGCPELTSHGPIDFSIDAWSGSLDFPVVSIAGFRMAPVDGACSDRGSPQLLCYGVQWQPLASKDSQGDGNRELTPNRVSKNLFEADAGMAKEIKCHSDTGATFNGTGATADGTTTHTSGDHANLISGTGAAVNARHDAAANARHEDSVFDDFGETTFLLTDRDPSDPLISALARHLEVQSGSCPFITSLSTVVPASAISYICLGEMDAPVLHNITRVMFEKVQSLLLTCHSLLWVTVGAYRFAENPDNNVAQGLLRTVRSETSKMAAILDLDPASELGASGQAELIVSALRASLIPRRGGSDAEAEFVEEGGQLAVPRILRQQEMELAVFRETHPSTPYEQDFDQPGRRLMLAFGTFGALDSLYWKDEVESALRDDEIEIKISATGMNFKDVVIATGQLAGPYIGVECSGIVSKTGTNTTTFSVGDRVCAMSLGAYGTYTRCPATSAARLPPDVSLEVAASIPVIYCTAYYGLMDLARIQPGESVLIHAASGGVGQAAIQLARMVGAEIYATVGSVEKKKLLMDVYQVPEAHIFYSRDTCFGAAVKEATGDKGVDVVVNSLSGDLLRETWECLAPFGRFIEIGKKDIMSNTRLEMGKFEYNCTFSSVDLTKVAAERPEIMGRILNAVMELLSRNVIGPVVPITTVGISEVETALRKLQSGKTSGKVIVNHLLPDQQVKATHPVAPKVSLATDATYLIIGGTGGLGRSITKRLASRGAGYIVLASRSGRVTSELDQLIQDCGRLGTSVIIEKCDAADEGQVNALVEVLQETLPPIRGVIHAAMVLKDILFESMTFDDYDDVLRPKVYGARNIHNALAKNHLEFFVVLSSVAGIVGNRGQAAYAAGNTFLDALTRYRRRRGLASASLNLAAIEGVGFLAENPDKQTQVLENLSGKTLREPEFLALVEAAIDGRVGRFCDGQCVTGLEFTAPSPLPYYGTDSKFSILGEAALARSAQDPRSSDSATLTISQKLLRSLTLEEALEIVSANLRDRLGVILRLSPEVIAAQQSASITSLGLDSLTAIELRNWIGRELQAHLQVLELLSSGALLDLALLILQKTTLEGVWS